MVTANWNKPNETTRYATRSVDIFNSAVFNPFPPSFGNHIASHKRPDPADILYLASKGRLAHDNDTLLFLRNSAASSHPGRPSFDDPVHVYVPLLARPQILHYCHADTSCHLGVTRTLEMLQRFFT